MKFTESVENYSGIFKQLGKNKWITLQEIIWYVDYENKNEYRIIPEGFIFNGGNSPCFTHCIVDDDDYPFAFCGHDYDYSGDSVYIVTDGNNLSDTFKKYKGQGVMTLQQGIITYKLTRGFADKILYDTLQVEGLSKFKSFLTYLGVRLGGGKYFTI